MTRNDWKGLEGFSSGHDSFLVRYYIGLDDMGWNSIPKSGSFGGVAFVDVFVCVFGNMFVEQDRSYGKSVIVVLVRFFLFFRFTSSNRQINRRTVHVLCFGASTVRLLGRRFLLCIPGNLWMRVSKLRSDFYENGNWKLEKFCAFWLTF